MTPLVLGIDPGPTRCGWALIDVRERRPRYVAAGVAPSDYDRIAALLRGSPVSPAPLVAIEVVAGYVHEHARAAALLETSRVVGRIEAACLALGLRSVAISAVRWRARVCGSAHPSDDVVKRAVTLLVADWPKRSSVHARDAAGCALGALFGGDATAIEASRFAGHDGGVDRSRARERPMRARSRKYVNKKAQHPGKLVGA